MVALKKNYIKLIFRGMRGSLNRFISILGIVALGTGFLVGLWATTPDMQLTADSYFDEFATFDINIKATMGITENDIITLASLDDVELVTPAYVSDAVMKKQDDESFVVRIFGTNLDLPESERLNRFELLSGRMPEIPGECVIAANGYTDSHNPGDTFVIEDAGDMTDIYAQTTFTVVGIVRSPLFISVQNEVSTVGSGSVALAMFVDEECFDLDVYTDLYLTVSGARELDAFSDTYTELISRVYAYLEDFGVERGNARYDEIVSEATEELEAAKADYYSAKDGAEEALQEALSEINDAKSELEDAEAEIADAEADLENQRSELAANRSSYYSGVAALNESKAQLEAFSEDVETAKEFQAAGFPLDDEALVLISQYDEGLAAAAETERYLAGVNSQLNQFERALDVARAELDDSIETVRSGWLEIEDAEIEYLTEKAKVEADLADAWAEIENAEADISAIEMPEWYLFDRDDNVGFSGYKSDVEKVAAISKVFPVFFFIVATLVALTTMTRMVEEQRTQIGTLKALGYTNGAVLCYYMIYGLLASILGCIVGAIPGFKLLPAVISNAYKMLYTLPSTMTPFRWDIALIASLIIVSGIAIASYAACRTELRNNPAGLLVASAPKPGKRIFLERMRPLWKRLPFSYKVTARNLFRYKKRFLMTIIGVAGCTALLVAGFGLKDSISDIVEKQFGEIYLYDLSLQLSDENPEVWDDILTEILSDETLVRSYMQYHSESATVAYKDDSRSVHLSVPKNADELKSFINLRERKSGRDVPFGDSSVVITEKLAETMDLTVGDSLALTLSSGETASVTITGITENYVASYLYISPEVYRESFFSAPEHTYAFIKTAAEAPEGLTGRLLKSEQVEYILSTGTFIDSLRNSLGSIDYIVLVLIICSGALAIIVLYNLTNINICERKKELATIKVLGFYDREVSAYIFREINILSIIGTAFGLVIGIWLHAFVVETVEVEAVMFGRSIYPLSFLLAAAMTVGFTLLVNLLMRKQLHSLDMVESMKAND